MLSRAASGAIRSQAGKRLLRQAPQKAQRRNMGGGGGFMQTNSFGVQLGEVFGTIAWLWVFHRFRHDGAVLLGYQHPWEHGGGHGHGDHGHGHGHGKPLSAKEQAAAWETFNEKSMNPEEDDDEDDEDEDDDDE